ncbi:MAG: hypothetical protein LBT06_11920 [Hungatella sp.]|nr:hypothetical protein [Hungatella sp.]
MNLWKVTKEMNHTLLLLKGQFLLIFSLQLDGVPLMAFVPLLGAIDFSPEERIPYLQRFNTFINDKNSDKVRIVNSEQPKAAVFCLQGLNVIYIIDHDYQTEKIHCFETDLFNDILSRETSGSTMKLLDFRPAL